MRACMRRERGGGGGERERGGGGGGGGGEGGEGGSLREGGEEEREKRERLLQITSIWSTGSPFLDHTCSSNHINCETMSTPMVLL